MHDSSEEDGDAFCECKNLDGHIDDGGAPAMEEEKMLSEEEKRKLMEERQRKCRDNERCCMKYWRKMLMKKIIICAVAGSVVAIAAVATGCFCYDKKCKKSSTGPDQKHTTLSYANSCTMATELESELDYVKEPHPAGDLTTTGSMPPAYTTLPMYGGGPGELILTAPPPYTTEEDKTALW
ncbi:uncharacterized protein LOC127879221 isoform X2 [Dreissena polymorpha]|nr:uncharacterized protein LOC127879221 isoform X2 [Dreissena polymorpha]